MYVYTYSHSDYKKYICFGHLNDQIYIYFSYIFDLHPQLLAHSSLNSWIFLGNKHHQAQGVQATWTGGSMCLRWPPGPVSPHPGAGSPCYSVSSSACGHRSGFLLSRVSHILLPFFTCLQQSPVKKVLGHETSFTYFPVLPSRASPVSTQTTGIAEFFLLFKHAAVDYK